MQNSWDFSVYDPNCPRIDTDTSTAARLAAAGFEVSVRLDPTETGAFFQPDGKLIFRKAGGPNNILFLPHELVGVDKTLFTHNHPGGNSFSTNDVQHAVELELIELRAVAPRWRYIMRPGESWPTWQAIEQSIQAEVSRAMDEITAMVKANQIQNQYVQIELLHQLWIRVSKSLNFHYHREAS